jgi:uncharacterized membrane protein
MIPDLPFLVSWIFTAVGFLAVIVALIALLESGQDG